VADAERRQLGARDDLILLVRELHEGWVVLVARLSEHGYRLRGPSASLPSYTGVSVVGRLWTVAPTPEVRS
jgi:hypothetical protein